MRLRLYLLFVLLLFYKAQGNTQVNLVPNPGFEIYDTCPEDFFNPPYSGISAICRAIPWFQPNSPYHFCSGSTDYFHQCANSVPKNLNGYQYARTGMGYAGAGIAYVPGAGGGGEYLEVQLVNSMKHKKYCVSFYVNTQSVEFSSTSCIQARFTKDSVITNSFGLIELNDGIGAEEIVRDTLNWILIKGEYFAKGGEIFMTIGCFDFINWDTFLCSELGCGGAAYYFDDFGVYELPEISAGFGGEIDTLGENTSLQASCEGCWNDLVYRWWPSAGLSDTTILNPIATPEVTTTYYFGLIDTSETVPCIVDLVDSVTVFVTIPQDTVTPPPTSFSWLVYPSPTSGNLTLQFSALNNDSQLLIIDSRGRLVRKISIPKNTESFPLDISALAAGAYFLQVENEVLKEKRKITKY